MQLFYEPPGQTFLISVLHLLQNCIIKCHCKLFIPIMIVRHDYYCKTVRTVISMITIIINNQMKFTVYNTCMQSYTTTCMGV